jgi:hypothetical protein
MANILLTTHFNANAAYAAGLREKTCEMLKKEWDTLKEWIAADCHKHGMSGGEHTAEYRNLARTVLAEFQRRGILWPE